MNDKPRIPENRSLYYAPDGRLWQLLDTAWHSDGIVTEAWQLLEPKERKKKKRLKR